MNRSGPAGADARVSAAGLSPDDLLPGDVLLYRPKKPNFVQRKIAEATDGPYTHAAIYLGDGQVAESVPPAGVRRRALTETMNEVEHVAVKRSQCGFSDVRPEKLATFVDETIGAGRFYDFVGAARLPDAYEKYRSNEIDILRQSYGAVRTAEEFAKDAFFCSALVVACYSVVGIVGETAQPIFQPKTFSPTRLYEDVTFGWLLGHIVPEGEAAPEPDPAQALWRDNMEIKWWK